MLFMLWPAVVASVSKATSHARTGSTARAQYRVIGSPPDNLHSMARKNQFKFSHINFYGQ